jgi:large subunit ribosomal protein L19|uniref:Large ribosomal subunit protein bL19c n=1 Tax=Guillardia theta TaxID=55529 RepID=A0A0U2KSV2_GUITH|nr:ribosomal protein L19 [Guillardia theta]|tara:strand:- start:34998 stop:35366 length:369 start_codon:yes stop_codon:yes gene_type:complete
MELKISLNPIDIKQLEQKYINNNLPDISVGDTVKIGVLITEGNKERVQFSEGVVISRNNNGLNTTVTVRRVVQGIGVERIYLINSPKLKSFEILRSSKIRRSKLYYLRSRVGKATRLQQKFK